MKSNLFWLNAKDIAKGLIVALLTAIGTTLTVDSTVKSVLIASTISFSAYLLKNFFTDHNDKILPLK